jgi:hypothetical protein
MARHPTMSPRALDWCVNGVPVYIRRRPVDGSVYATTCDFSKFLREEPLETLRIPVGDVYDIRDWKAELDPRVIAALDRHATPRGAE